MEYSTLICPNLYRITFPYKDIYTTVCVLRTDLGDVVVDLATYDEDMENVLFPALAELGVTKESLKYALITHKHADHAGGLSRFLKEFDQVTILSTSNALREEFCDAKIVVPKEGEVFLNDLKVVFIPGHTLDSIALIDRRTNTLVCGDCLQQYGIFGSGKWGSNIRFPAQHFEAIKKLREEKIDAILGAHDFHPMGYFAQGEDVKKVLDACEESLFRIRDFLNENSQMSDEQLASSYNAPGLLPTVGSHVFQAFRNLK